MWCSGKGLLTTEISAADFVEVQKFSWRPEAPRRAWSCTCDLCLLLRRTSVFLWRLWDGRPPNPKNHPGNLKELTGFNGFEQESHHPKIKHHQPQICINPLLNHVFVGRRDSVCQCIFLGRRAYFMYSEQHEPQSVTKLPMKLYGFIIGIGLLKLDYLNHSSRFPTQPESFKSCPGLRIEPAQALPLVSGEGYSDSILQLVGGPGPPL